MFIEQFLTGKSPCIQRAFIREFDLVLEKTDSATKAFDAAKALIDSFKPLAQQSINRNVIFEGELAELEIDLIPSDVINEVKKTDAHPFFAVYKIGKDGVSNGQKIRKFWSFGAIKELATKIKEGVADIIIGHTEGNESKPSKGNVVWAYTKKIGNSLYSYAVAHIRDEKTKEDIKSGKLDLCSVEGEIKFSMRDGKQWFIENVLGVSKLALASSATDKAGFEEAGIVTTIQELESKGNVMAGEESRVESISKYDIKVAIERLGLKPEDLFRESEIRATECVKKTIDETKTQITTEKQKEIDGILSRLNPLEAKERSNKLAGFVDKTPLLTDKPASLRDYIKSKVELVDLGKTSVDDTVAMAKVEEFVKKQLEDITKYKINFGEGAGNNNAEDKGKENANTENKNNGSGNNSGKYDPLNINDMSKPENNTLIPKSA